ncbi:MAG: hypothetical protein AAF961_05245 [Planctomycetota bacterium]
MPEKTTSTRTSKKSRKTLPPDGYLGRRVRALTDLRGPNHARHGGGVIRKGDLCQVVGIARGKLTVAWHSIEITGVSLREVEVLKR